MSIPARKYHTYQTTYILADVAFDTPGISAGVQVASIPAGAQVVHVIANVTTAFNAGTTNVLTVGTTAAGTDLMDGTTSASGTAGAKEDLDGRALTFAADTPVFVKYAQTGTAATAGKARIAIEYLAPSVP